MVEEEFEKGDQIFDCDEVCDKIYFITEGKVEIEIHNEKNECITIETLGRGDIIGQYSFIVQETFQVEAVAKRDTKILTLNNDFI